MIMKRRNGAVFLAAAMLVLFGNGCGSSDTAGSTKIYYTAIESGDYYEGWASRLEEQASAQGASFAVGYAENSVETQDAQIKEAAAGGYDVLLCGLVSPDTVTEIKAAAGDTPMVFINNAPADSALEKDKYVYVASDEFMAGQYQAEYILERFGQKDEINVAILKGPKDASGAVGRTKGLKQTLKASGKKINYVFEDNAGWNTEKAQELMAMFLKTGQPVDCVASNNDDMALGAVPHLNRQESARILCCFSAWMLLWVAVRRLPRGAWISRYSSRQTARFLLQSRLQRDLPADSR